MKNNYFLWLTLLIVIHGGYSQQSYAEGFTWFDFDLGNIDGQNGWQAITSQGDAFGGATISDDDIAMFSEPNFLKIAHDPNFPPSSNLDFFCLSPSLNTVTFQLVQGNGSVSFYIQPNNDNETPGANYAVQFDDGVHVTASVLLLNDGSIAVADKINGILQYVPTTATWTPEEDKQLNIFINLQAGTLRYNIQGEDIYVGNTLNGTALERFSVSYDNQPGSVAYFDSLFVFGYDQVLESPSYELSHIQLYPNPTSDKIYVSGLQDILDDALVYGIDGKILPVLITSYGSDMKVYDVSGLTSGVYFLKLSTKNGTFIKQFIKQ